MFDEEANDETRYAPARARFSGLIGQSQSVSRGALVALVVVGTYALAAEWRHSSQMASIRAEKNRGFVVVVDRETGERLDVKPVSAAEWRLSDGMVRHKLTEIVSCLRGMDAVPDVTRACWKQAPLNFEGELAVNALTAYRTARFRDARDFEAKAKAEVIDVTVIEAMRPDQQVPGRWWMRWAETHKPRSLGAKSTVERWAGTFDVELVPLEEDRTSTGLRITRFEWHKDVKPGEG